MYTSPRQSGVLCASSVAGGPLPVRGLGEALDGTEPDVPGVCDRRQCSRRFVEPAGLDAEQHFTTGPVAADEPGLLEDTKVLDHGLTGERHLLGEGAGRSRALLHKDVEETATGRVRDRRPQIVIRRRRHPATTPRSAPRRPRWI